MIVWRDIHDEDTFHFGYEAVDIYWCLSAHLNYLEDLFGDVVARLIRQETKSNVTADLEDVRNHVLQELVNEVREHCATIAESHAAYDAAAHIREYTHELGTEDS